MKVSRKPDRAVVIYDDAETSLDKLVKIVEKAGYGAKVLKDKKGLVSKK